MGHDSKDYSPDQSAIDSFGHEWASFDYRENEQSEALNSQFCAYFTVPDMNLFDQKFSIGGCQN